MSVNIHATCVKLAKAGRAFGAPAAAGVLILGRSGKGKSDLALRLIAAGATLVSDDRTDLAVERGRLTARAPRTIRGLLEVRGLGIVRLPHAAKVRVSLVIQLGGNVARIPERVRWVPPPTLKLQASRHPPLLVLEPFESSAPAKVAAAVAAFSRGLFAEDVKRQ